MEKNLLSSYSNQDEFLQISPEGLSKLASRFDPNEPLRHIVWTTDYTMELPISMKREGPGKHNPTRNFIF